MNKNYLIISTAFLFVLMSLTHITSGYNERNFNSEFLNENFISEKSLYRNVFESYSTDEIPDFFEYQFDNVSLNQSSKRFEIRDHFEPSCQISDGPMDSAWPMYCHDVRHTGRSPYSTSGNVGFNKWWYKCDMHIEGSAAIDKDGIIYFGGVKGGNVFFYALYPNGTLKWKCEIDELIEAGPAIAEDGTIYVGECIPPSNLYSISPDGIINWKYQIGDNLQSSPAIGEDGTIYIGDGGNWGIRAINPNGTLKWCYKTNMIVYSSPAIGNDGTVYCGSHDNYLYALYPNNGTLKWKYKTGHWIRTSPCIGDDGTIYCVSLDNYLHAVNPDGTRKWRTNVGAGTSPTIGQDGTIYAGYDNLHAVNPVDGSFKWTFNIGGTMRGGTPSNSADGTIYVGTSGGGKLIAINPDGTEKWRQDIGTCEFAPVIGEDGTVYIGTSIEEFTGHGYIAAGYLHAFNEKGSQAPTTPKITGPAKVNSKTEIDYTFKSISPLGNDIYYWIDWGDGDWKKDWWIGPFGSGENGIISHTWSKPGEYTIKCRCKDSDNLWGDWSEFKVNVPRNRVYLNSYLLKFTNIFQSFQRIFAFIK